jgi:hypothetical protein
MASLPHEAVANARTTHPAMPMMEAELVMGEGYPLAVKQLSRE